MRETPGTTDDRPEPPEPENEEQLDDSGADVEEGAVGAEEEEVAYDWTVFLFRAAALVVFGATLITSFDLSRNQDVEWLTVMRLAILPFVGGMVVLAAGELLDRRGD